MIEKIAYIINKWRGMEDLFKVEVECKTRINNKDYCIFMVLIGYNS